MRYPVIEAARAEIIGGLLKTGTIQAVFPTWKRKIDDLMGTPPTASSIFGLADHLRDIFKETGEAGRGQSTVSAGGAAWEALVCYYLNLCLIGSNALVFKKGSHIPSSIRAALTVTYGTVQANTEADLVAVQFPDSPLLSNPLMRKETAFQRLSAYAETLFGPETMDEDFRLTIIQTKTNWNDNAQIPMLWSMVYSLSGMDFRGIDIKLGAEGYSLDEGIIKYAFVTAPSNRLELFKPQSLAVQRVNAISGKNYWGLASRQGIALSLKEFFPTNKIGPGNGKKIVSSLNKALDNWAYYREIFGL